MKQLYTPILIALVILLIAAIPLPPNHPEAHQPNAITKQHDKNASVKPVPKNHIHPKSAPKANDSYTYNYYYPATTTKSPSVLFQEVTTSALILFTFALCVTAYQQWLAVISADQARIYLSKLTFGRIGGDIYDSTKMPIITVGFRNYGRTIATVTEAKVAIKVIGEPPTIPEYKDSDRIFIPAGKTIIPNSEYVLPTKWFIDFKPEETGPTPQLPFRAHFYVYGFITYRDHLGKEHRTGFLGIWLPPSIMNREIAIEDFIWSEKKNYTYNT